MKCTYKILPQFSLILEQFEGAISIDDSIEMTNRLIIDSQYSSLYNILVDLREFIPVQKAQHHIQDIDIFLNFFNGNHTLPNSTMAFIISEPIHAIITELFKEKVPNHRSILLHLLQCKLQHLSYN